MTPSLEFEFFLFMYNAGWIELGALGLGIEIKPFLLIFLISQEFPSQINFRPPCYNIGNQNCVQWWDLDNEKYWKHVPCNAKHNVFVCERDGKANMTLKIHVNSLLFD